jgi:multiple sugar transport system substrate-binding protein
MNAMTLRLALVGGPMYDGLYRCLEGSDVELVVHADHPTLNRAVAERLGRGERIDLLSTHSKYAPSQAQWLRPLDELLPPAAIDALAPAAVALCRFEGVLLCAPRNIDVRVLWANRARLGDRAVPATWDGLVDAGLSFAFPGRESGLFGTFYELVTARGGRLFDEALRPTLATPAARHAVLTLAALARQAPSDLPDWHYDQVDAALGAGRVDLAAAWPGATAALRAAAAGAQLEPHPYLAGAAGLRSYAGCHAWAIPATCGDPDAALGLLARLCAADAQALDAQSGSVCAHVEAFGAVRPRDEIDGRRLAITRRTIESGMITYPPLRRFPAVEDAGWLALHRVLRGGLNGDTALQQMQTAAEEVLR